MQVRIDKKNAEEIRLSAFQKKISIPKEVNALIAAELRKRQKALKAGGKMPKR